MKEKTDSDEAPPNPASSYRIAGARPGFWLAAIVVIALVLRWWSLFPEVEFPGSIHPDAPKQIHKAREFLRGDYFRRRNLPDYDGYPVFHMHILEWTHRAFVQPVVQGILGGGLWENKIHIFDVRFLAKMGIVLNCLYGSGTVIFLYLLGRRFFDPSVCLMGALWFALFGMSVGISYFNIGETSQTFFAAGALYFAARMFRGGRMRDYILSGLFSAFSASCKYNGGIIILAPLLAHFFQEREKDRTGRIDRRLGLLVLSAGMGFVVGNPHLIGHPVQGVQDILNFLRWSSDYAVGEIQESQGWWGSFREKSIDHFTSILIGFGIPNFVFFLLSFAWVSIRGGAKKLWWLVSFPVLYIVVFFLTKSVTAPYYYLVLAPPLFLIAAYGGVDGFRWVSSRFPAWRWVPLSVLAAVALYNGYSAVREVTYFYIPETRYLSFQWVRRNIPYLEYVDSMATSWRARRMNYQRRTEYLILDNLKKRSRLPGYRLIKSISLENGPSAVKFRNADLKLYQREKPTRGKSLPYFFKSPLPAEPVNYVFCNGFDPGPDPTWFSVSKGGKYQFVLVSERPLDTLGLLAFNSSPAKTTRVSMETEALPLGEFWSWFPWPVRRGKVEEPGVEPASEGVFNGKSSEFIVLRNPVRAWPLDKYFYRLILRSDGPFTGLLSYDSGGFGIGYFVAGRYPEAVPFLDKEFEEHPGFSPLFLATVSRCRSGDEKGCRAGYRRLNREYREWMTLPESDRDEKGFSDFLVRETGFDLRFLKEPNEAHFPITNFPGPEGKPVWGASGEYLLPGSYLADFRFEGTPPGEGTLFEIRSWEPASAVRRYSVHPDDPSLKMGRPFIRVPFEIDSPQNMVFVVRSASPDTRFHSVTVIPDVRSSLVRSVLQLRAELSRPAGKEKTP